MTKFKKGDLISKRYKIEAILGKRREGGMGELYLCRDLLKNQTIVLKTFKKKYLNNPLVVDRFKYESLAWILLGKHPFIVNAYYVIKLDKRIYIALEYIEPDEKGRNTLKDYYKDEISLKQALIWSIQFCSGMEYANSKGIEVHFDIKPSNIMITKDKILKISDFGLARVWENAEPINDWKSLINSCAENLSFVCVHNEKPIVGSPPWMAPERFEGKGDIRSDIYSFGIVMYQMVNKGKMPFSKYMLKHYYLDYKHQPDALVKEEFYPIIEKCLQKSPNERYQNFSELKQDLENLLWRIFREKISEPIIKEEESAIDLEYKGISFYCLGLYKEAVKYLESALKIDPNNQEASKYLEKALKKKNKIL